MDWKVNKVTYFSNLIAFKDPETGDWGLLSPDHGLRSISWVH